MREVSRRLGDLRRYPAYPLQTDMHTIDCSCGNSLAIVPPSEHAGYLVLDSEVDLSIDTRNAMIRDFLGSSHSNDRDVWLKQFYGVNSPLSRLDLKDDADIIEDILSAGDSWTRYFYRCPMCGRIYIETSPGSRQFRAYVEE